MNTLRLRIFFHMMALGLVPLTVLVVGLRFLPGGVLPWLLYSVLSLAVFVFAVARSGSISRPLKDALDAMAALMRSNGTYKPRAWVPKEYWALQDSLARVMTDEREQRLAAEKELLAQSSATADAESVAMRSLEVLNGVAQSVGEGLLFVHSEGHAVLINQRVRELFQLEGELAQPGCAGADWLRAVAQKFEKAPDVLALWEQWHRQPGTWEETWTTTDHRNIAVRTFDIRLEQGTYLGRLWMFTDHSEKTQMEQRLREAQKMESMGQLAGGIAHDFNNLLTAIRGNLALAELDENRESTRSKLEDANRAAGRAVELVGQILGYSRKSREPATSTNITQTINDVRNILRASLDPKVTLRCNIPNELWTAAGDPVQIEQVLLNICLNARDALPETGGTIDISGRNIAETMTLEQRGGQSEHSVGDYVVIKVKDNGCGIPADVKSRIFEPYFTTKDQGKGTGLGLSMAKNIIEKAGGWIEVDSAAGEGTEFRIFLPRVRKADEPLIAERPMSRPLMPKRGTAEGTILVVDDEAPVRSIAVNMLKYLGYKVIEAQDGEEALQILQSGDKPVDAMMMDVYMPKLSGRDTFKKMRALDINVPVIVCSGFMIEPDEFKSLGGDRHGYLEVIQKPYSMESLARIIGKAVSKSHEALVA